MLLNVLMEKGPNDYSKNGNEVCDAARKKSRGGLDDAIKEKNRKCSPNNGQYCNGGKTIHGIWIYSENVPCVKGEKTNNGWNEYHEESTRGNMNGFVMG